MLGGAMLVNDGVDRQLPRCGSRPAQLNTRTSRARRASFETRSIRTCGIIAPQFWDSRGWIPVWYQPRIRCEKINQ